MSLRLPKIRVAVCPGTFDPITFGHLDIIGRALKVFDRVVVAVSENQPKEPLFGLRERMEMVRESLPKDWPVEVEAFEGLVTRFARRKKAVALVRGVRMLSDFEYEFQMALTNRKLDSAVETIFLMPNESYAYLTSRLIKEIVAAGGDVRSYVPQWVYARLLKKLRRKG